MNNFVRVNKLLTIVNLTKNTTELPRNAYKTVRLVFCNFNFLQIIMSFNIRISSIIATHKIIN